MSCTILPTIFQFAFVHYFTKFGSGEVFLTDTTSSEEEDNDDIVDDDEISSAIGNLTVSSISISYFALHKIIFKLIIMFNCSWFIYY